MEVMSERNLKVVVYFARLTIFNGHVLQYKASVSKLISLRTYQKANSQVLQIQRTKIFPNTSI
jgi:hypothetical protein